MNEENKGRGKRRGCTQMDRTEFNSDVLEVINRDFRKMQKRRRRRNNNKNKRRKGGKRRKKDGDGDNSHEKGHTATKVIGNKNQEAVDWMFHRLDRDKYVAVL